MDRRHKRGGLLLATAVAAPAVLLAACGGSSGGTASPATSGSSGGSSGSGTAQVATHGSGSATYLTDSAGRSLYLFESDHGSTSTCNGACVSAWPPLLSKGQPTAAPNAHAGMVGTITRSDGSKQVTYAGHPLYYYAGDANAGETNGEGLNGFGALWYLVSPSGATITHLSASSGSSGSGGSSSSGYGGGY
jgi:predicted lipoprotein with Yx(FWY)xxD motif